jgi:SAD/SRA domain/HNH endonuclease
MFRPGDVISYIEMCRQEGASLQRGMNYRLRAGTSVILMSVRPGAPYADRIEEEGRVLIYEGHNISRAPGGPDPKKVDQPDTTPNGTLTQNGHFMEAVKQYRNGYGEPEPVRVYEKIKPGIWTYSGLFKLIDGWREKAGLRHVFKFKLELIDEAASPADRPAAELDHDRMIPTAVKLEVWKRDKGACVLCGSAKNLHFDHIIPYSRGGSSLVADNVQLLCAKHNLAKRDHIE